MYISYVFLLSYVICHSYPGTYMRLEIPRASKAWTCADLHWFEKLGRNLAMGRKFQTLGNAYQIMIKCHWFDLSNKNNHWSVCVCVRVCVCQVK